MQLTSKAKAVLFSLALTVSLCSCVPVLPTTTDEVFAVMPRGSVSPIERISTPTANGKDQDAVNGHDVLANFEMLARTAQKIQEATTHVIEAASSNDQGGLYSWKLTLVQEVVELGASLRATINGLDQNGALTYKAMGRIRPLLQLFRVTTDAFTQAMETNANALDDVGAGYIPKCFVGPYGVLLHFLQHYLVLKTEGFYQANFEQEVEQVISNVEDIEDHFPRYADAQTCAAAQAKAGDPSYKFYDLSSLYALI